MNKIAAGLLALSFCQPAIAGAAAEAPLEPMTVSPVQTEAPQFVLPANTEVSLRVWFRAAPHVKYQEPIARHATECATGLAGAL